jgi:GNAT superfamily N-acetyltransferase
LSHSHNNAARVFLAYVDGTLAGFCSVLQQPHGHVKNLKRIHRLVVLPDFQGIGIGIRMLDAVSKHIRKNNYRLSIVTSAPSLIWALKKHPLWNMTAMGRKSQKTGKIHGKKSAGSGNRLTTTFEMIWKQ